MTLVGRLFALALILLSNAAQAQPCAPTVLVKASGKAVPVEEALTRTTRVRGLMHRKTLKEGTGMWFVFENEKPRSF